MRSQTSDYKNSLVCFFKIFSWALLSWMLFLIFNVQVKLLVHLQTLSTKASGHTEDIWGLRTYSGHADFMVKGSSKLFFMWTPGFIMLGSVTLISFAQVEKKKKWYSLTKWVLDPDGFSKTFTFPYWIILKWEMAWALHFWKATQMILMHHQGRHLHSSTYPHLLQKVRVGC